LLLFNETSSVQLRQMSHKRTIDNRIGKRIGFIGLVFR
jgi:hypothetical protein